MAIDVVTLALAKKYTDSTVAGAGGLQGKSAYEIAIDNGFTGSERDWLDSLQGNPPYINSESKFWMVYDPMAKEYYETTVLAQGLMGADGKDGKDGKDGVDIDPTLVQEIQDSLSELENLPSDILGLGTSINILIGKQSVSEEEINTLNNRIQLEEDNLNDYKSEISDRMEGLDLKDLQIENTLNSLVDSIPTIIELEDDYLILKAGTEELSSVRISTENIQDGTYGRLHDALATLNAQKADEIDIQNGEIILRAEGEDISSVPLSVDYIIYGDETLQAVLSTHDDKISDAEQEIQNINENMEEMQRFLLDTFTINYTQLSNRIDDLQNDIIDTKSVLTEDYNSLNARVLVLEDNYGSLSGSLADLNQTTMNALEIQGTAITDLASKHSNLATKVGATGLKTVSKNVSGAINELFQYASDGKKIIADAITGKGVEASSDDNWDDLGNKILSIATSTNGNSTEYLIKVTFKQSQRLYSSDLVMNLEGIEFLQDGSIDFSKKTYIVNGIMLKPQASFTVTVDNYDIAFTYNASIKRVEFNFFNKLGMAARNMDLSISVIDAPTPGYGTSEEIGVAYVNDSSSWTIEA